MIESALHEQAILCGLYRIFASKSFFFQTNLHKIYDVQVLRFRSNYLGSQKFSSNEIPMYRFNVPFFSWIPIVFSS